MKKGKMKNNRPSSMRITDVPHTKGEWDYYYHALIRHPWTEHDITLARWRLKLVIEAGEDLGRRQYEGD